MDNPGEILRLCRLCLVKDQVNIPIFEEQGDIRQIFLKISSCLPVKVSRDDQLPKKICDGCLNKLDLLYEFWNTSVNAEKTLLSWLGQAGVKDADEKISAVAQQIAKSAETQVKQEALEDGHAPEVQSFEEEAKDESEAPPPKRARRTAAVKAQINITPESDDDDDMDSAEAMTKVEDESDESDGEDKDPSYGEVPGTSADDQAGPSGVGKDGVEAPSNIKDLLLKFNIKECHVIVEDVMRDSSLKFVKGRVKIPRFKYKCYVCSTRFIANSDLETHRKKYGEKGCKYFLKIKAAKQKRIRKKMKSSKRSNNRPQEDNSENMKDNFLKNDEGSVFSCKHCWKVFLSKRSLQEHINFHFQNSEIDQTEVEEFYNDYVLLRPGVDPFLTTTEVRFLQEGVPGIRFRQEASCTPANYDPGPGPSHIPTNNNTSIELNLNPGADVEKTTLQMLKTSFEEIELSPHEYLVTLPSEDMNSQTIDCSTVEQAVCTTQPPNLLVNREHFSCNKCDNLFLTFESFGQHIVNEKCLIIGKCCLCRNQFSTNRALYEHVLNRHSKYRVICNFCFKMFISFENLQKHIIKKHHYY